MPVEVEVGVIVLHHQVVKEAGAMVAEEPLAVQMANPEEQILVAVAVEIIIRSAQTVETVAQV
jgi:hypothetical protein